MNPVEAMIRSAHRKAETAAWLNGERPDSEIDESLPKPQRNGPRYEWLRRNWVDMVGGPFQRLTGIPHDVVTWEYANDPDDGWPSVWIEPQVKAGKSPDLPAGYQYLLAWTGIGAIDPLRVERSSDGFEVWAAGYSAGDHGGPKLLLELIEEERES